MYVDQEFIKKWKKWILDIARFETTTTIYGGDGDFGHFESFPQIWPFLVKLGHFL